MRALVYFRGKGETTYRELGLQEMKALPPKGGDVTVDVDGKRTQARVMDRREFVSRGSPQPLQFACRGRSDCPTRTSSPLASPLAKSRRARTGDAGAEI
jgi:hypothetical protein